MGPFKNRSSPPNTGHVSSAQPEEDAFQIET